MKPLVLILAAALAASISVTSAQAAEVEVKMLNMGPGGMFVFQPNVVKIQPGDTVHFIASDKGHNVESIEGMLPEGATPFTGAINKDLTVTFDKSGIYGFRCKPHYGMGMVGAVIVGEPVNLAAAKAVEQPGKAKPAFEKIWSGL
jgi:pseudoazurin